MKVLVLGASGTIGKAVVAALTPAHAVVAVSRTQSARNLDMADPDATLRFFGGIDRVDAIICAAGQARFGPLTSLTNGDFEFSLRNKLMGQVNLIRFGLESVNEGGSITVTSGVLSHRPIPGSGAVSLVNAGLEGFVRAAALEAPRGIRINVVSPPWVKETMVALGMDPTPGTSAADVAQAYLRSLTGTMTGAVLEA